MNYGPITHAGSNWRKLCAKYGLDPLDATADDVEQAIRFAVAREGSEYLEEVLAGLIPPSDSVIPQAGETIEAVSEAISHAVLHAVE